MEAEIPATSTVTPRILRSCFQPSAVRSLLYDFPCHRIIAIPFLPIKVPEQADSNGKEENQINEGDDNVVRVYQYKRTPFYFEYSLQCCCVEGAACIHSGNDTSNLGSFFKFVSKQHIAKGNRQHNGDEPAQDNLYLQPKLPAAETR